MPAEAAGASYAPDDPAPRALTAVAFGCLVAAQHAWLASARSGSLASYIDRAMATSHPRSGAVPHQSGAEAQVSDAMYGGNQCPLEFH
jgi:hypothetical protein